MNELIEKIYGETCLAAGNLDEREFCEKFAQLIIQECVKHITDQQDLVETNWGCKDGIHIVYSLKEHFGVEE